MALYPYALLKFLSCFLRLNNSKLKQFDENNLRPVLQKNINCTLRIILLDYACISQQL